ncbi:hypothetical protein Cmaq_1159 [Caldivirga maquilingensis IC-167]|uniref:Uncharacterized protein n=1 Tax=Caldivirga maquilingensis (strain ATCC 700844 / DSM 13496 / JCM 10307 / IC-167) TaxID=397948 RepID=A8MDY0_CALMQ|nr:hypothetical protein Cmaq_1159 [Caldivirga maquilingensis IC-167]
MGAMGRILTLGVGLNTSFIKKDQCITTSNCYEDNVTVLNQA